MNPSPPQPPLDEQYRHPCEINPRSCFLVFYGKILLGYLFLSIQIDDSPLVWVELWCEAATNTAVPSKSRDKISSFWVLIDPIVAHESRYRFARALEKRRMRGLGLLILKSKGNWKLGLVTLRYYSAMFIHGMSEKEERRMLQRHSGAWRQMERPSVESSPPLGLHEKRFSFSGYNRWYFSLVIYEVPIKYSYILASSILGYIWKGWDAIYPTLFLPTSSCNSHIWTTNEKHIFGKQLLGLFSKGDTRKIMEKNKLSFKKVICSDVQYPKEPKEGEHENAHPRTHPTMVNATLKGRKPIQAVEAGPSGSKKEKNKLKTKLDMPAFLNQFDLKYADFCLIYMLSIVYAESNWHYSILWIIWYNYFCWSLSRIKYENFGRNFKRIVLNNKRERNLERVTYFLLWISLDGLSKVRSVRLSPSSQILAKLDSHLIISDWVSAAYNLNRWEVNLLIQVLQSLCCYSPIQSGNFNFFTWNQQRLGTLIKKQSTIMKKNKKSFKKILHSDEKLSKEKSEHVVPNDQLCIQPAMVIETFKSTGFKKPYETGPLGSKKDKGKTKGIIDFLRRMDIECDQDDARSYAGYDVDKSLSHIINFFSNKESKKNLAAKSYNCIYMNAKNHELLSVCMEPGSDLEQVMFLMNIPAKYNCKLWDNIEICRKYKMYIFNADCENIDSSCRTKNGYVLRKCILIRKCSKKMYYLMSIITWMMFITALCYLNYHKIQNTLYWILDFLMIQLHKGNEVENLNKKYYKHDHYCGFYYDCDDRDTNTTWKRNREGGNSCNWKVKQKDGKPARKDISQKMMMRNQELTGIRSFWVLAV